MTKFFIRCLFIAIIFSFVGVAMGPLLGVDGIALAQDVAETETAEPPAATSTPVPASDQEPVEPTQIPEPVTVILFGSGLAALSASVARKRKKQ